MGPEYLYDIRPRSSFPMKSSLCSLFYGPEQASGPGASARDRRIGLEWDGVHDGTGENLLPLEGGGEPGRSGERPHLRRAGVNRAAARRWFWRAMASRAASRRWLWMAGAIRAALRVAPSIEGESSPSRYAANLLRRSEPSKPDFWYRFEQNELEL